MKEDKPKNEMKGKHTQNEDVTIMTIELINKEGKRKSEKKQTKEGRERKICQKKAKYKREKKKGKVIRKKV